MEATPERTVKKRVVIDLDRCIECGSCAAACYYSHANMPAIRFARAGWAILPVICRQCISAPCVDACPAEAMFRDDSGLVRRRLFRCIGCGSCARACPFGIIPDELAGIPPAAKSPDRMSGREVAKCDLCADRTAPSPDAQPAAPGASAAEAGQADPRCVAACCSGALTFVAEREGEPVQLIGGRTAGDFYKRR